MKNQQALLGFEPRISCLRDRRFSQLSHRASCSIAQASFLIIFYWIRWKAELITVTIHSVDKRLAATVHEVAESDTIERLSTHPHCSLSSRINRPYRTNPRRRLLELKQRNTYLLSHRNGENVLRTTMEWDRVDRSRVFIVQEGAFVREARDALIFHRNLESSSEWIF